MQGRGTGRAERTSKMPSGTGSSQFFVGGRAGEEQLGCARERGWRRSRRSRPGCGQRGRRRRRRVKCRRIDKSWANGPPSKRNLFLAHCASVSARSARRDALHERNAILFYEILKSHKRSRACLQTTYSIRRPLFLPSPTSAPYHTAARTLDNTPRADHQTIHVPSDLPSFRLERTSSAQEHPTRQSPVHARGYHPPSAVQSARRAARMSAHRTRAPPSATRLTRLACCNSGERPPVDS